MGIDDFYKKEKLEELHSESAIAERITAATTHSYLGDFVLGAVDGTVTTFAIVATAAGAALPASVALIMGLANVLADGFSMAASNYLKTRAEHENLEMIRKIEHMHIDEIPEGERQELREIFSRKGFSGETLEEIVQVLSSDRKQWVDIMLTEEWGLRINPPNPKIAGAATFVAFVIVGLIPLMPLLFFLDGSTSEVFAICSVITGLTFFIIGYWGGIVSKDARPYISAIRTFAIGGGAALLAYGVGKFLEGLI